MPAENDSPAQRVSPGVLTAAVAGNALEFYDFLTYGFFAVYIGQAFFPSSTPMGSLLMAVAVFGAGFVTRPVGAILLGKAADRRGRRPTMLLTIGLITVGTLGLALMPTYEQIGLFAPALVVACRLLQGFALGGEVGSSTAFLVECAPTERRGLFGSLQLAGQGVATVLAGAMGVVMTLTLTPEQMQSWGWRAAFLLGVVLIPVAIYLRRFMPETLPPRELHRGLNSTGTLVKANWRIIVLATLLVLGSTVSVYVGAYMTSFAIAALKLPAAAAMGATLTVGISSAAFAILGGTLSDRLGRRPLMIWPRVVMTLLAVPAFTVLVAMPSTATLILVSLLLGSLTALSAAPGFAALMEALPSSARATGFSIAYAVGVAIFGGSTQLVLTWLVAATNSALAPGWYLAACSAVAAAAAIAFPETRWPRGETTARSGKL